MMRFAKFILCCATLSFAAGTGVCAGLLIIPTFGSSITGASNASAIESTINSAIQVYQTDFADPITVNIAFQAMTSGLGESSTSFENISYATYLTALTADATTANDTTALAGLVGMGPNNPVTNSATINVKIANLRAVGLLPSSQPGVVDGTVSLNTSITNPGTGVPGSFSLLAVAEHEIDEVLGLGSALPDKPFSDPFPEDLFRYTSSGVRTFTTDGTVKAFFSLNGTTDLAQFDNQNDGGDFGDWQSNPLLNGVKPQVQDAFATVGSMPVLGINELTALDVIGYNLEPDLVAPEPSTWALIVAGLGFLALRRRVSVV